MAISPIRPEMLVEAGESPSAEVSNEFLDYQYQVLGVREYLDSADVRKYASTGPASFIWRATAAGIESRCRG